MVMTEVNRNGPGGASNTPRPGPKEVPFERVQCSERAPRPGADVPDPEGSRRAISPGVVVHRGARGASRPHRKDQEEAGGLRVKWTARIACFCAPCFIGLILSTY